MQAGDHPLLVLSELGKDRWPDARQNSHLNNDTGRSGAFSPEARQRRAHRANAEWKHVHGAALHAAFEEVLEAAPHHIWVFPIVGRPGSIARKGTDIGAIFNARHIARDGSRIVAARPALLIGAYKCARRDKAFAEEVVLSLRSVNPMDGVWPAEVGHLFDPSNQVLVGRGWSA